MWLAAGWWVLLTGASVYASAVVLVVLGVLWRGV
jgi:hypothetical protein